jgi:hypothetical protein
MNPQVLQDVHDQAMKAYRRRRGTAPLILNLGNRCRRVASFTPGERTLVPSEQVGRLGRTKISFS